ncbi:CDP-diacylglycerol--glycerol-3-phosphate 3-phosphatidyltransferase [Gemmatimonadota bacterium]
MTWLPNTLTSIRLVLVPVFLWLVTRQTLPGSVLALVTFVVASVTDSLDGYYARKYSSQSDLGRFLDPLADKLLVLSAFYWGAFDGAPDGGWFNIWLVHVIALREIVITALRTMHRRSGKQIITAWAGKWKAVAQMTVLSTVLTFEAGARVFDALGGAAAWLLSAPIWFLVQSLFGIAVVLTVVSGVRYFTVNYRTIPLGDGGEDPGG